MKKFLKNSLKVKVVESQGRRRNQRELQVILMQMKKSLRKSLKKLLRAEMIKDPVIGAIQKAVPLPISQCSDSQVVGNTDLMEVPVPKKRLLKRSSRK